MDAIVALSRLLGSTLSGEQCARSRDLNAADFHQAEATGAVIEAPTLELLAVRLTRIGVT